MNRTNKPKPRPFRLTPIAREQIPDLMGLHGLSNIPKPTVEDNTPPDQQTIPRFIADIERKHGIKVRVFVAKNGDIWIIGVEDRGRGVKMYHFANLQPTIDTIRTDRKFGLPYVADTDTRQGKRSAFTSWLTRAARQNAPQQPVRTRHSSPQPSPRRRGRTPTPEPQSGGHAPPQRA